MNRKTNNPELVALSEIIKSLQPEGGVFWRFPEQGMVLRLTAADVQQVYEALATVETAEKQNYWVFLPTANQRAILIPGWPNEFPARKNFHAIMRRILLEMNERRQVALSDEDFAKLLESVDSSEADRQARQEIVTEKIKPLLPHVEQIFQLLADNAFLPEKSVKRIMQVLSDAPTIIGDVFQKLGQGCLAIHQVKSAEPDTKIVLHPHFSAYKEVDATDPETAQQAETGKSAEDVSKELDDMHIVIPQASPCSHTCANGRCSNCKNEASADNDGTDL